MSRRLCESLVAAPSSQAGLTPARAGLAPPISTAKGRKKKKPNLAGFCLSRHNPQKTVALISLFEGSLSPSPLLSVGLTKR